MIASTEQAKGLGIARASLSDGQKRGGRSMERRSFLATSLAASALAINHPRALMQGAHESGSRENREYYQLRRYVLTNGFQRKLADDYFRDALVPALNRLGITPVGIFSVAIGPEMPAMYVLMPSPLAESLVNVELHLSQDADYMKAGTPFLNAPAKEPAFVRMESWLLHAFEKMPRLRLPAASTTKSPRIFELRTYESPSDQDHKRKIEQMCNGVSPIFEKAGFWDVFYGDTLVGSRLPNLIYMIGYESFSEHDKHWSAFQNSTEWKELSADPRYTFEDIVSSRTVSFLTPTLYSQI